jgi:hypothetical protein
MTKSFNTNSKIIRVINETDRRFWIESKNPSAVELGVERLRHVRTFTVNEYTRIGPCTNIHQRICETPH